MSRHRNIRKLSYDYDEDYGDDYDDDGADYMTFEQQQAAYREEQRELAVQAEQKQKQRQEQERLTAQAKQQAQLAQGPASSAAPPKGGTGGAGGGGQSQSYDGGGGSGGGGAGGGGDALSSAVEELRGVVGPSFTTAAIESAIQSSRFNLDLAVSMLLSGGAEPSEGSDVNGSSSNKGVGAGNGAEQRDGFRFQAPQYQNQAKPPAPPPGLVPSTSVGSSSNSGGGGGGMGISIINKSSNKVRGSGGITAEPKVSPRTSGSLMDRMASSPSSGAGGGGGGGAGKDHGSRRQHFPPEPLVGVLTAEDMALMKKVKAGLPAAKGGVEGVKNYAGAGSNSAAGSRNASRASSPAPSGGARSRMGSPTLTIGNNVQRHPLWDVAAAEDDEGQAGEDEEEGGSSAVTVDGDDDDDDGDSSAVAAEKKASSSSSSNGTTSGGGGGVGGGGLPKKDRMSMVVIGHVDAGKSTLMGQTLFQVGSVSQRVLHKHEKEAKLVGKGSFYLAWIMDEDVGERAHGVTIDIATKYMETETKLITVLDAPGHRDFIPRMISGASSADAAVLVVPAASGEFESAFVDSGQTKEHATLVKALGVNQVVVAINKVDATEPPWSEARYLEVKEKVERFLRTVGFKPKKIRFVPVSGLSGENVKARTVGGGLAKWYNGPTFLEAVDGFTAAPRAVTKPLRLSVSDLVPTGKGVCVSGKVLGGRVKMGDKVVVMPVGDIWSVGRVERQGEICQSAQAGDNAEIFLAGAQPERIAVGDVVCKARTPCPVMKKILVQILTLEALEVPIIKGTQFHLHMHSLDVVCHVSKLQALTNSAGEAISSRARVAGAEASSVDSQAGKTVPPLAGAGGTSGGGGGSGNPPGANGLSDNTASAAGLGRAEAIALSDLRRKQDKPKRPRCIGSGCNAHVVLVLSRPLCIERFCDCKPLGRFVLRQYGATVAVGMVLQGLG